MWCGLWWNLEPENNDRVSVGLCEKSQEAANMLFTQTATGAKRIVARSGVDKMRHFHMEDRIHCLEGANIISL